MQKTKFEYYRSFETAEDSKTLVELLKSNDIEYLLEAPEILIDKAIVGSGLLPKAILKLKTSDFSRVNELLETEIENAEISVQDDYLNQLENEELIEILENPDEWSIEDRVVAQKILQERGIEYSKAEIEQLKEQKLSAIRKGKSASTIWLLAYFFAIMIGIYFSVFFVIAGIGMGYYYAFGKSTDMNGDRYFVYDTRTRYYGKLILVGGFIGVIIQLLFFLNIDLGV